MPSYVKTWFCSFRQCPLNDGHDEPWGKKEAPFCHSRENGNPGLVGRTLDARLRLRV